jgi:hypothetical protein
VACKLDAGADKHACRVNADCDDGRMCAAAGVCVPGVAAVAAGGVQLRDPRRRAPQVLGQ